MACDAAAELAGAAALEDASAWLADALAELSWVLAAELLAALAWALASLEAAALEDAALEDACPPHAAKPNIAAKAAADSTATSFLLAMMLSFPPEFHLSHYTLSGFDHLKMAG